MSSFRLGLVLLLLSFLRCSFADYDPRNYDDLYELKEYYGNLYTNDNSDVLDDAFGYVNHLLALGKGAVCCALEW